MKDGDLFILRGKLISFSHCIQEINLSSGEGLHIWEYILTEFDYNLFLGERNIRHSKDGLMRTTGVQFYMPKEN